MSLLSSFLSSHLVPALEAAFQAHEPDMQAALISEVASLSSAIGTWVESKTGTSGIASSEPVSTPIAEA